MPKPANQPTPEVADDVTAPRLIEIFRAGRHTDMHGRTIEFTADDIKRIADSYDPQLHQAPVVVGHPKIDAPAYGWIDKLVADGDSLYAAEAQVDEAFDGMRKAGRFKNRSASFYTPDAANNPAPGGFYIKHVGWLGAAAPSVKGLKQVSFGDDGEGVVEFAMSDRRWGFRTAAGLFRGLRDYFIEAVGLEKADKLIPTWQIDSLNEAATPDAETNTSMYAERTAAIGAEEINREDNAMPDKTAEFAERETKLNEREQRIADQEKRLAERADKERRDDAIAYADNLVEAGKVLPAEKATVIELLLALPTDKPLAFGEGDDAIEAPAPDLLRGFLDSLPPRMDFSEKSRADDSEAGAASFAAPIGTVVDAGQLELHRKARAYQAEHAGVSFAAAYKAVGGR